MNFKVQYAFTFLHFSAQRIDANLF